MIYDDIFQNKLGFILCVCMYIILNCYVVNNNFNKYFYQLYRFSEYIGIKINIVMVNNFLRNFISIIIENGIGVFVSIEQMCL